MLLIVITEFAVKGKELVVVLCAICYHFYGLKNVKNTHVGVLLLVKLQALQLY